MAEPAAEPTVEPETDTPEPENGDSTENNIPEFITQGLESAPEEIKAKLADFKGWNNIKDLPNLLNSYVEAQSMAGKIKGGQFIELPGEGALPAQWDKVWSKLGRPENVDGYKESIEKITAALPEGVTVNENILTKTTAKAHALGVNPAQLSGIIGEYMAASVDQMLASAQADEKALKETTEKVLEDMRGEYGAGFDEKMAMAQEIIGMIFENDSDPSVQFLRESGLEQDPRLSRFLIKVADFAGPENIFGGRYRSFTLGEKSEQEIKDRIVEIRADMNKTGEGALDAKSRKILDDEMSALYREQVARSDKRRDGEEIVAIAKG